MGFIKNQFAAAGGAVTKAIIEIFDERELAKQVHDESSLRWQGMEPRMSTPPAGGMPAGEEFVPAEIGRADAAGNVFGSEKEFFASKLTSARGEYGDRIAKKRFIVKFNPASINIQAMGGGNYPKQQFGGDKGQGIDISALNTTIQFDVKLIFDDYNYNEAFMNPTLNLSAQNYVDKVSKLAVEKIKKNHVGVQEQVEALTGAIRNEYTRYIAFNWGELCYQGVANKVTAEYSMFSTEGRPMRATVNLGIQLQDYTTRMVTGGNDYWHNAYEKAFNGQNDAGSSVMDSRAASQFVQNLLNLG